MFINIKTELKNTTLTSLNLGLDRIRFSRDLGWRFGLLKNINRNVEHMLVTIPFIDIIYPYNIITMIMKAILAVTNTTWAVVKIRPGKNSSLCGI